MSEETLPGGNTDGAVRIGDVVHKQAAPWTPTVHALLRHLEEAGVDGVPRALGFDEQGRQMLTYLPGEMIGDRDPWPAWVYADSTLVQVGHWMRRVHDATATFVPPEDECWFTGRTMQPGMIVGHQDVAPYNAVMDGDRLAGFFDWDIAFPSPPEEDLAFSALLWVPLTAPEADEEPGAHDVADRSRRLHLFLGAYRYDGDREAFAAAIVQRARRQASAIRSMAEAGDRAATALLPIASRLEQAASYVEALPDGFWTPLGTRCSRPEQGASMLPGVSVTRLLTGPDRCRAGSPAGSPSEPSAAAAGRARNPASKAEGAGRYLSCRAAGPRSDWCDERADDRAAARHQGCGERAGGG